MTALRCVLCLLLLAATRVDAGTGELDPTFGGTGRVIDDFGTGGTFGAFDLALQPDGRIVVAGSTYNGGNNDDLLLVRYLPDGTLDPSFGTGGVVRHDFGGTRDWITGDVVVQADGRIVLCGELRSLGGGGTVLRFEADGSVDGTFGAAGQTVIPFLERCGEAAIQPDGKILVAGTGASGGLGFALGSARLDTAGALDPTYGAGGVVLTDLGATLGGSLALQADGRIVVTGTNQGAAVIVRYQPNGQLDPTFGTGGVIIDPTVYGAADAEVLPDGRILVSLDDAGHGPVRVARLNADGTPDPTFGTGGRTAHMVGVDLAGWGRLLVEPDGRIVVAGGAVLVPAASPFEPAPLTAGLVRLLPDGSLDRRFGIGGVALVPEGGIRDVARQADGRLVGAGSSGVFPTMQFATVRYDGVCPALPDTDGDGVGDACDPCTGGAAPERAVLQLRRLEAPAGDEMMRFTARATVPGAPVDPPTDGLRLVVENAGGDTLVDAFVPPFAYDDGLKIGWSTNATGSKFTYKSRHPTLPPLDHVTAAKVKRLATPGALTVRVQAADASYAAGPANLPARATLVFGAPFAEDGRCIEIAYPGPPPDPACRVNAAGTTVRCR